MESGEHDSSRQTWEFPTRDVTLKAHLMRFIQTYDSANIGLLLKEDAETHIKQCTSSLRRNTRTRKVYDCQASGLEILVPTRPEEHEELTLIAQSLPAIAFDFLAFGPVDISVCDFGMKLSNVSKR